MQLTEAKKRHRAGGNKSKSSRNRKAEDKQSQRQLKGHLMQRAAKLRSERAELAKELAGCADSVDPELTNRDRQHLRQAIIGEDDAQSDLYSKMATNANRREFEFNEQQGQLSLDLASQLMRTRDNSALERERRSDTPPVFETVSGPTYLADAHFRSRSDPSLAGTGSHCSPFAVWPVPKRCKKIVSEDDFWDNISAFQQDKIEAEKALAKKNRTGRVPVELRAANALEYSRRVNEDKDIALDENMQESLDFGPVEESADVQQNRELNLSERKEDRLEAHHSALYFVNDWNRYIPSLLPQRMYTMGMLANNMTYTSPVVCYTSPHAYVEGMKRLMRRGARLRMEELYSATEDQHRFPGQESFSIVTFWTLGLPNVGLRDTENEWENSWFEEENLECWGVFGELWEQGWWNRTMNKEDNRSFHYGYWKKQRYRKNDSEYGDYVKHLEECIKQVHGGEIPEEVRRERQGSGKYDDFKKNKFARPAELQGETVYKYDACMRVSRVETQFVRFSGFGEGQAGKECVMDVLSRWTSTP